MFYKFSSLDSCDAVVITSLLTLRLQPLCLRWGYNLFAYAEVTEVSLGDFKRNLLEIHLNKWNSYAIMLDQKRNLFEIHFKKVNSYAGFRDWNRINYYISAISLLVKCNLILSAAFGLYCGASYFLMLPFSCDWYYMVLFCHIICPWNCIHMQLYWMKNEILLHSYVIILDEKRNWLIKASMILWCVHYFFSGVCAKYYRYYLLWYLFIYYYYMVQTWHIFMSKNVDIHSIFDVMHLQYICEIVQKSSVLKLTH